MKKHILLSCFAMYMMTSAAYSGTSLGTDGKVYLQAAMQQYVERNLVDGVYLYFDEETNSVQELYPAKAHPMIMKMGKYYVLCTDFLDNDGKSVNIDFYVAQSVNSYKVFHTEVDNRRPLENLMKAGKLEAVN